MNAKKIKLLFYSIFFVTIISCQGSKKYNSLGEESNETSIIEKCLHIKLGDYYKESKVISDLLLDDFSLDGSITNYVEILNKMENGQFDSLPKIKLEKELESFYHQNDIVYKIHTCSQMIDSDKLLNANQKAYFKVFNKSAKSGYVDNVELSRVIKLLSEEEFKNSELSRITSFYVFNYLVHEIYYID